MIDAANKEHRSRMKAQYRQKGIDSFSDREIVELLLFFAIQQGDTAPLANALIDRFGSIHGILQATPEQLSRIEGISEHAVVLLSLCGSLIRKCGEDRYPVGMRLTNSEEYGKFFLWRFWGYPHEVVMVALLNDNDKVLGCNVISEGSIDASEVNMPLIMHKALVADATKVIIAHNHPAGHAVPSEDDARVTKRLSSTLESAGIRLLDHIVVADGDFVSMRETPSYASIF